jgi:2-octaprenyl-6-methoxyphenol hydroxylase
LIDVAIVGGGPVGATLAARLGRQGLDCAIYEARSGPVADARTLALSEASREGLVELGAWPGEGVTAITSIHVSQLGGPGRTLIEARDQGLAALGHTVAFTALERVLHAAVASTGARIHFAAACERIDLDADAARLVVAGHGTVEARLLVLADGGANAARIPGVAFSEKDYGQQAVLATIGADRAHEGRAWERFTPDGPMALLPVGERYALVWTAAAAEAARLRELDEAAFAAELQARFGDRAGRFHAPGPRASFPLRLRVVNTPVALRTAIVGNAAQALHPIAGQGLNLGLRDAHQLADTIAATGSASLGTPAMLDAYREGRRRDTRRGVAFTDLLVSAFALDGALPKWGRGLALAALDVFPPARRLLAQRMIHGAPGS